MTSLLVQENGRNRRKFPAGLKVIDLYFTFFQIEKAARYNIMTKIRMKERVKNEFIYIEDQNLSCNQVRLAE